MQVFHDIWEQRFAPRSTVVTIGNFDGVHRGHQFLFSLARQTAEDLDLRAVAVTFAPHPLKLIFPERRLFLITPPAKKIRLIAACGLDALVFIPFNREFADLTAPEFARLVLVEQLGVHTVIVGGNYRFGRDREGDVDRLRRLGDELGFATVGAPTFLVDGRPVSSTRVRQHIMAGEVQEAARLLGRYYTIEGVVGHGKNRGKQLGFPTANLRSEAELYPREGVYAVWVDYGGRRWNGVLSIGYNPTFGDTGLTVEVHILDFAGDLYGETLKIHFLKYLRGVMTFTGMEALKEQITADIAAAAPIFGLAKAQPLW